MRILAGKYKGRELKSPKGKGTRPTTSLMRKAVFDIACHEVIDASFLDLFAGTGAMGLEALSRGSREATFVEKDTKATHLIHTNLKTLDIDAKTGHVLKGEALSILKRLAKAQKEYDMIYIDPPYDRATMLIEEILPLIDASSLLTSEGLLFLETEKQNALPLLPLDSLELRESRKYGMSQLHIFQRKKV